MRSAAAYWPSCVMFLVALVVALMGWRAYQHRDTPAENGVGPHVDPFHAQVLLDAAPHQIVRGVDGAPLVDSGQVDAQGRPVLLSCASCHSTREPRRRHDGSELELFHQGLHTAHGSLSCQSCHAAPDYGDLRLADGTRIAFERSMQLCSQCHGQERRDYDAGLHGGMAGFWDATRGPQERKSCTDCHDAHAPAFPQFDPVFPPKFRFMPARSGDSHE